MKKITLLFFTLLSITSFGQGFLHRDGQRIVDGNGQNVLLRGLGLGGWMVQEGYMLQTDAFAGPQHKIKQKIAELVGPQNTEQFYQAYRNNGITKRDIDSLAAWGFNSVRLPMHYNLYTPSIQEETNGQITWREEGFTMTDNLLEWCAANNMYLILDMHAAPGGQGRDANISDYDTTLPSLWESEANRTKMIALWRKLADRYKNSPWIGAYDLINEPNWSFAGGNQNVNGCDETSNAPLRALMVAITQAIREVDTNHMIIIEGNCWGNNYNGIIPDWDPNMALSFHKYWNSNAVGAIQGMLNLRTQHNIPIWLGESGENSNVWFRDAIKLVESNNIGWAFWPMKKIESIAGVTSVTKTPEYEQLLQYWRNGGTQPTPEFAMATLMQIAENYKMQNVTVKPDVIDAMFRQVQSTETKKYKSNAIPGKIYATHYDLGPIGYAYSDKDFVNYRTDTGVFADWNKGWSMRNDGVDIEKCTDAATNGFQVGFIDPDEWLLFTIPSASLQAYDVDIRYSGTGGKLHFEDANGRISESITLPGTGGYTTWATFTVPGIILKAGDNKVKVYFETAGFNMSYFDFKNPRNSSAIAMKVIHATTTVLGDKVNVTFNKELQTSINFSSSNLVLKVNGNAVPVSSIGYSMPNMSMITIRPVTPINASDVVTISYGGSNIIATDATSQPVFTDVPVQNKIGNILAISGKIEAENFYANNGLNLETTTDVGGGQNIAYTDAGDSLDYLVNIAETGNYKIEYRTSGESQTGSVKLQLINDDGTSDIQTVNFSPTGGWQTWQTVASRATLPAGRFIARILIESPGFNFNWVRFTLTAPDDDNDGVPNALDLCPTTPTGDVVNFDGCSIFVLAANNFAIQSVSESCRNANNGSISVTATATNQYVATISGNGVNQMLPFTSAVSLPNLAAGTYNVCFTIPSVTSFQRCFDIVIREPAALKVMPKVSDDFTLTLDLEGGNTYKVELNGEIFTTTQNSIELHLKGGANEVTVKTDKDCQGTFKQSFTVADRISVYPNPATDEVFVNVPVQKNGYVSVQVFSMLGNVVLQKEFKADDKIALNIEALAKGTYAISVATNQSVYHSKIVKQ